MMVMRSKVLLTLLVLTSVLIVGCGGGGGGGGGLAVPVVIPPAPIPTPDPPAPAPAPVVNQSVASVITGIVSDGPIANARVYLDLNGNGSFDAGEPFDITNTEGRFTIKHVLRGNTEYLLVAEGQTVLDTTDPQDNPGVTLNFVMYTSIPITEQGDVVTKQLSQSLTPTIFKEYLTNLDTKLGNALRIADPKIAEIIDLPGNSTAKEIFDRINTPVQTGQSLSPEQEATSSKTVLSNVLTQISEAAAFDKEKEDTAKTAQVLNLDSSTNMVFSTSSTTELTKQIAFVNNTVPAKVGDIIVSNVPKQVVSTSAYQVFITPYKTILDIPEYGLIRNHGFSVYLGADVIIKEKDSGRKVTDLTQLSDSQKEIIWGDVHRGLALSGLTATDMHYLSWSGSGWVTQATSVAVGSSQISGITSANFGFTPFILARPDGLQTPRVISSTQYEKLTSTVVIARGLSQAGAQESAVGPIFRGGTEVIILDAVLISGSTVTLNIPKGFEMTSAVLMGSDLELVLGSGVTSVNVAITTDPAEVGQSSSGFGAGTPIQTGNTNPVPVYFVSDLALINNLNQGNALEKFPGIHNMIETRVANEMTDLSFPASSTGTQVQFASSLLSQNFNQFLRTTAPQFITGGTTDISWSEVQNSMNVNYTILVNNVDKKLSLSETVQTTQATVSTRVTEWSFATGSATKSLNTSYFLGSRAGSTQKSTVIYSSSSSSSQTIPVYLADFVDERKEINLSASGYRSDSVGSYKGTVFFTTGSSQIQSAIVTQSLELSNTQSGVLVTGKNSLKGLYELLGGNLKFEGEYTAYLVNYSNKPLVPIEGRAAIQKATSTRGFDGVFYNSNSIEKAIYTAKSKPSLVTTTALPQDLTGSWQGSVSSDCQSGSGTMSLLLSQPPYTWVAQFGTTFLVGSLELDLEASRVRLFDGARALYAEAEINPMRTEIKSNPDANLCKVTFTLVKQ